MSMIFPGMDPYLEKRTLWSGVHNSFNVYLRDRLRPLLGSRYVAAVEERVYLEGPDREIRPDVSLRRARESREGRALAVADPDEMIEVWAPAEPVRESYVNILDLENGQRIVTVIELVSPSNKYAGSGRTSYLAKQEEVLSSDAHLVEIDLLRQGNHVLAVPEASARARSHYDYLICVNRAFGQRDRYGLYPRILPKRLPRIRIPLADPDPDVVLDVQAVLEQTYDAGRYRDRIDYDRPCEPPLTSDQQAWARGLIEASRAG